MASAETALVLPHSPALRAQVTPWVAMAHAVGAFLAALGEEKRQRTLFAFDNPERFNWHYIYRVGARGFPSRR
jgi:hypothetical protein